MLFPRKLKNELVNLNGLIEGGEEKPQLLIMFCKESLLGVLYLLINNRIL